MKPSAKEDEEQKIDYHFAIFLIIGFVVSMLNMYVITIYIEIVMSYLVIIFLFMIPGIVIALKVRIWGYGYMLGFTVAGIPGIFLYDMFIGSYTVFVSVSLFIILYLIFWKTWRSISGIKVE